MDIVTPGIGLVFWTGIIFLLLLILLTKFAWVPITAMINKRNQKIEDALNLAAKTQEDMKQLQANNNKLLAEAKLQRDNILQEAKELKEQIVAQAKQEANKEMEKIKLAASLEIQAQKALAVQEIKSQILDLSVMVAEKLIRNELKSDVEQERLVNNVLNDINFN